MRPPPTNLAGTTGGRLRFVAGEIANRALMRGLLRDHQPAGVINFAAETHVDRSILFPDEFVQANVTGTFNLLDEVRHYWDGLQSAKKTASGSCRSRPMRSMVRCRRRSPVRRKEGARAQ